MRRETVAEQGRSILRAQILEGVLRPGDPVTEEAMAQELGMSRPTMREVLRTLVAEGLLTRHPTTRILSVTTMTIPEVEEIYLARRVLECAGIDAAASVPDEAFDPLRATVARLADAVERNDVYDIVQADRQCHTDTVALVGSRHLSDLHAQLMAKMNLTLALVESEEPGDNRELLRQLEEFRDLVVNRRTEEAKAQLLTRLETAEHDVVTSLSAQRSDPTPPRRSVLGSR